MSPFRLFPILAGVALFSCTPVADESIREAVTFYASFDRGTDADFGAFPEPDSSFHAAPVLVPGAYGHALKIEDPATAAVVYRAQGNLRDRRGSWSGTLSFWIQTDGLAAAGGEIRAPVQIAAECGSPSGIWVDHLGGPSPELRLGVVLARSDPAQPRAAVAARLRSSTAGSWRHVAVTWANFDSGRSDAWTALYLDGDMAGTLTNKPLRSGWDGSDAFLCVGVNYTGAIDELVVLSRPLSQREIRRLRSQPALLAALKGGPGEHAALPVQRDPWLRYSASLRR